MSDTPVPYITPGARSGLHKLAWAVIILFIVDFALTGAALVFLSRQVDAVTRDTASSCAFFRDLGTAPVGIGSQRPSQLGVSIVADSRAAYRGLGCRMPLPPPDPSFVRWARFYHLPAG